LLPTLYYQFAKGEIVVSDKKEVIRENGRFVKGVSGNPRGRPLGAKNRIVRMKQDMEEAIRTHMHPGEIQKIVQAMVLEAQGGNVAAAKLILDKVMSNANISEDSEAADNRIVIKIENYTPGSREKVVEGEIIDSEE
jgi:hypothetical protein